jgi:phospholipid/cholesterol/gamma-HCH transport system substrate-binding protein
MPTAPSGFHTSAPSSHPSLAFAQYDPASGSYVAPDGQSYRRSDLAPGESAKSWQDLMLRQHT